MRILGNSGVFFLEISYGSEVRTQPLLAAGQEMLAESSELICVHETHTISRYGGVACC